MITPINPSSRILLFVLLTTSVLALWYCEEEPYHQREYPRITEMQIKQITDSGAFFSADLYSLGSENLLEFGFLWGKYKNQTYSGSNRISLGKPEKTGLITAEICSALLANQVYYARAYARTDERIVYGPERDFISLGGKTAIISSFEPHSAAWGDTIKIRGKYFSYNPAENVVYLNKVSCPILRSTDTSIVLLVSPDVRTISNQVSTLIGGQTSIYTKDSLKLIPPYINSFYPIEGTWGSSLTIKGRFNPSLLNNNLKVGGIDLVIKSFSRDSVKIQIPVGLRNYKNAVELNCPPFNIVATDSFRLSKPELRSISPDSGVEYTIITLKGRHLYNGQSSFTSVKIGGVSASIFSINDTIIKFTLPGSVPSGPAKITVCAGNQIVASDFSFLVTNPRIFDFSPTSAKYNDVITIRGKYLKNENPPTVSFASIVASNIISSTDTLIKVNVPDGLDSFPRLISVTVDGVSTSSTNAFKLAPPVISGISPNPVTAGGQDIVITGAGFNPVASKNKVLWDIYPLVIKNVTSTQITATLPGIMTNNGSRVAVTTGVYTRRFFVNNSISSKWTHYILPATISWFSRGLSYRVGFATSGKGYMIDNYTGSMISFDPVTKGFESLGRYPIFTYNDGTSVAVLRDTAYAYSPYKLYRYDVQSRSWINIGPSAPAGSGHYNGVFISLVNNLYYGLSTTSQGNDVRFWSYNPISKTWIQKSSFPSTIGSISSFFSVDSKGYVLFSNKQFWEYDPVTDIWRRLPDYPGFAYLATAFVSNGKVYIGTGISGNISTDDIYVYDPLSETWSFFCKIPFGARSGAVSFTINNKCYIGTGILQTGQQVRDLLEFDPDL
jgi:hypothetical protein